MRTARHTISLQEQLVHKDIPFLQSVMAELLPEYQVAILDEAHALEDVAAEQLGIQVTRGAVDDQLNKLANPRREKGLLVHLNAHDAIRQVQMARNAAENFFDDMVDWHARRQAHAPREEVHHAERDVYAAPAPPGGPATLTSSAPFLAAKRCSCQIRRKGVS